MIVAYTTGAIRNPWNVDEQDLEELAERIWKGSHAHVQSAAITSSGQLWFQALLTRRAECSSMSGSQDIGRTATRIVSRTETTPHWHLEGSAQLLDKPAIDEAMEENWDESRVTFNPDWLFFLGPPKSRLSHDALAFCLRQRLLRPLLIAIDLIKQYFPKVQDLHLQLDQDPETGDEWLVLDITVQGEVDDVLESYEAYTSQWVSSVPWPQRDKLRLSYNII
jgi:hypothetical protein